LRFLYDDEQNIFPNSDSQWEWKYDDVNGEVPNFIYGEPSYLPNIGLKHISEGQARFFELVFLNDTIGLDWEEFEDKNLLGKDYMEAFELFLEVTDQSRPKSINSRLVHIFLVICDIALNPSIGFIDEIEDFRKLCYDFHPGWRFIRATQALAKNYNFFDKISNFDNDDYNHISNLISLICGWKSLGKVFSDINYMGNALRNNDSLSQESKFEVRYGLELPISVIVNRFFKFVKRKSESSIRYCWFNKNTYPSEYLPSKYAYAQYLTDSEAPIHCSFEGLNSPIKFIPPDEYKINHSSEKIQNFYFQHANALIIHDIYRQIIAGNGSINYNYKKFGDEWFFSEKKKKQLAEVLKDILGIDINTLENY